MSRAIPASPWLFFYYSNSRFRSSFAAAAVAADNVDSAVSIAAAVAGPGSCSYSWTGYCRIGAPWHFADAEACESVSAGTLHLFVALALSNTLQEY